MVLFGSIESASARGFYFYSTGAAAQSNITLEEPIEGYTDFGVVFEQFGVLGIPIWNYGAEPVYAFYSDNGRVIEYAELSTEEVLAFQEENSIDLGVEAGDTPSLSFWNKIGGKLIIIPLLILGLWVTYGGKKKEESAE